MTQKQKLIKEFLIRANVKVEGELSKDMWEMFKHIKIVDLAKPIVIQETKKGMTEGQISIKYGITPRQIKHIRCSTKLVLKTGKDDIYYNRL